MLHQEAIGELGGALSDNSSRLTPSSTREDGKEGRVTRKAQQSRSEQPATPSSGSVAPRGELIRRDTEEALEPPERRRTGGYVADAKTSSHGHVRVASCQEPRRGRPQETPPTSRPPCHRGNGYRWWHPERRSGHRAAASGSTFSSLTSLRPSGGKEQERRRRPQRAAAFRGKTCLCGGASAEIKDYQA